MEHWNEKELWDKRGNTIIKTRVHLGRVVYVELKMFTLLVVYVVHMYMANMNLRQREWFLLIL